MGGSRAVLPLGRAARAASRHPLPPDRPADAPTPTSEATPRMKCDGCGAVSRWMLLELMAGGRGRPGGTGWWSERNVECRM